MDSQADIARSGLLYPSRTLKSQNLEFDSRLWFTSQPCRRVANLLSARVQQALCGGRLLKCRDQHAAMDFGAVTTFYRRAGQAGMSGCAFDSSTFFCLLFWVSKKVKIKNPRSQNATRVCSFFLAKRYQKHKYKWIFARRPTRANAIHLHAHRFWRYPPTYMAK